MRTIVFLLSVWLIVSCGQADETKSFQLLEADYTFVQVDTAHFMQYEEVYVPVYSDIYNFDEHAKYLLTITLSLRNTSTSDSLYISKVDYYDSKGDQLRRYLKNMIVLRPLETVDFVVENHENQGGTGANFLVDWGTTQLTTKPVIQAVMITTMSQQGISFITEGVTIKQKVQQP